MPAAELFALVVVPALIVLAYTAWDARRTRNRNRTRLGHRTVTRLQQRYDRREGTRHDD